MKNHFKDLFQYNQWANQRYIDTVDENEITDEKIITLYSHLLSVQIVFLLRIQGLPTSPFPLWEKYKISELQTMTDESARNWIHFIETHPHETFEEMIFYKDSSGKKRESTVRQMINQVISHGSYHRGQLAMMLRNAGFEPPVTDYIAFQRL